MQPQHQSTSTRINTGSIPNSKRVQLAGLKRIVSAQLRDCEAATRVQQQHLHMQMWNRPEYLEPCGTSSPRSIAGNMTKTIQVLCSSDQAARIRLQVE